MKKILFINASSQNGVYQSMIEDIQHDFWLEYSTELVSLQIYNIEDCTGCLKCVNDICPIEDQLHILLDKITESDIIVVCTPSYFFNIPSALKKVIDRSRSILSHKLLDGKKFVYIYMSTTPSASIKPYLDTALFGFNYCHGINTLGSFAVEINNIDSFKDESHIDIAKDISKLIRSHLEQS